LTVRGLLSGWGIRILVIAVVIVGGLILRDRLSSNAADLQVGDCFDQPKTASETIEDVQHHPCSEAHTAEVIFVGNHSAASGATPLTEAGILDFVGGACLPAFAAYTGIDLLADGTYDLGYIYPLDSDWNDGDREVTCYTYRVDGAAMTASLKKAP
jgi:Septum formation